jgi:hypothetical protein
MRIDSNLPSYRLNLETESSHHVIPVLARLYVPIGNVSRYYLRQQDWSLYWKILGFVR